MINDKDQVGPSTGEQTAEEQVPVVDQGTSAGEEGPGDDADADEEDGA